jgi:PPP family 3-phenylpropionic acid transporter
MRLGGSIGYAIMALISGFIIAGKTRLIFPLSITMFLTLAVAIALMPLIKGGRNKNEDGKKANYLTLFKNRSLVVILFFNFLVYAPYFFYAIFIGVRMREVGATNQMIGLANFLAAFCEIPFLFLADRLLQKYGFKPLLLIAGSTMALRLFLSGIIESAWILVFIHMLHGTGHIIASYCTSRYINTTVPNELKASGQTLLGMVTYGLAKMIASLLGGYAVDWIGILSFSPPVMSPLFITLPTSELSPLLALSDLQAKSAGNILSASMVIRNLRQSFITF